MTPKIGVTYKYGVNGKAWGTVIGQDRDTVSIKMEPDHHITTFARYELAAWLNEGILTDGLHYCTQCGNDMGNEYILGPVCGKCVRKNHRRATRS